VVGAPNTAFEAPASQHEPQRLPGRRQFPQEWVPPPRRPLHPLL